MQTTCNRIISLVPKSQQYQSTVYGLYTGRRGLSSNCPVSRRISTHDFNLERIEHGLNWIDQRGYV